MLDAAVRSLASGDPGAVSASRIAKESGATWGAVQYQFGDIDGFWAAVLHRTAERRDTTMSAFTSAEPDAPLRERVGAIIDTLVSRSGVARIRVRSKICGPHSPGSPTSWNVSIHVPPPSCSPGAKAGRKPARTPSPVSDVDPQRVREVAALIPGAMRGLVSERQLGSYADLDEARRGLTNALATYLEQSRPT